MSWTDERVEKLKAMWAEGQSASQIAKTLGGVTRNAVIGKVHRLGLSNRATAAKPAAGGGAAEAKPAKAAAKPAAAPAAKVEAAPAAAAPKPASQPSLRREPPPPTPAMVADAARTAEALAAIEKKAKKLQLKEAKVNNPFNKTLKIPLLPSGIFFAQSLITFSSDKFALPCLKLLFSP